MTTGNAHLILATPHATIIMNYIGLQWIKLSNPEAHAVRWKEKKNANDPDNRWTIFLRQLNDRPNPVGHHTRQESKSSNTTQ